MEEVNLASFAADAQNKRKGYRRFITKCESKPPKNLDQLIEIADREVWKEIDCTSCANCCKTMTPTFTPRDIKRAATFLHMTPLAFKSKWLMREKKAKDWVNVHQPCQFLDLATNLCTIYEARPDDCAGFPHLAKHKAKDYMHIHKQNMEYCPATLRFIKILKTMTKLAKKQQKAELTGFPLEQKQG